MSQSNKNLIAKRYSDALVALVNENNMDFKLINSQLHSIVDSVNESSELRMFMENPIISVENKKAVISDLLTNKVENVVLNFLKLLIEANRFDVLEEISNLFKNEVDNFNNVKHVDIVSAIELNDDLKNRLIQKLSSKLNKNVELQTEVDSSIIAGLVIKIDDNVIDMSLKHKFEEMEKQMIK